MVSTLTEALLWWSAVLKFYGETSMLVDNLTQRAAAWPCTLLSAI